MSGPNLDHQSLSRLAKPTLCGQCGMLWGEEGHGKRKKGEHQPSTLRYLSSP